MEQFEDSAEIMIGLGNCNMKNQNKSIAEKYFMKALSIDPNAASALMGLGLLHTQDERFSLAIKRFNKILSLDPLHDRALCGLAMVYEKRGELVRALEFYFRSLTSNVENPSGICGLLKLSYKLDRFEEIEHVLKVFIERHPANLNMLFGLAGIYYTNGKKIESIETLNRVLLFEPTHKNSLDLMKKINSEKLSV